MVLRDDIAVRKVTVLTDALPHMDLMEDLDAADYDGLQESSISPNLRSEDGLLKYVSVSGICAFTKLDRSPSIEYDIKIFNKYAFDIEVCPSFEGLHWPSDDAPLVSIAVVGSDGSKVVIVNGSYVNFSMRKVSEMLEKGVIVVVPPENMMVDHFFAYIDDVKPQVMFSWNGMTFDVPFLMNKSSYKCSSRFRYLEAKSFTGWTFDMSHGIHIDLFRMMDKKYRKLFHSIKLRNVALQLGPLRPS